MGRVDYVTPFPETGRMAQLTLAFGIQGTNGTICELKPEPWCSLTTVSRLPLFEPLLSSQ